VAGFLVRSPGHRVAPGLRLAGNLLRHGPKPGVNVVPHLVFSNAVAFLDFAFQLVASAIDDIEVIIGQLAPPMHSSCRWARAGGWQQR
jgi:hypothetical protein